MIGGVCAGVANYFDIDVTLVRLLFAIALLAFSTGFWLYLILWIVMPASSADAAQPFVEVQDVETQNSQRNSLLTGLVFIIAGVCFLLANLIPRFTWRTFWPILLIVLGLALIVPFKDKKS